jgi:hypothetical protein
MPRLIKWLAKQAFTKKWFEELPKRRSQTVFLTNFDRMSELIFQNSDHAFLQNVSKCYFI